jgi:hypothetical protein
MFAKKFVLVLDMLRLGIVPPVMRSSRACIVTILLVTWILGYKNEKRVQVRQRGIPKFRSDCVKYREAI